MTSIDKLAIRGVRSFSPVEPQIIEFHKPLTLIVGKNGSGKTTIIECLKMNTTGDLPPNCRSGQAFINDPNALGTSEVKAQIKLLFTTVNKQQAMCTRSFSLTPAALEACASIRSLESTNCGWLTTEESAATTALATSTGKDHPEAPRTRKVAKAMPTRRPL